MASARFEATVTMKRIYSYEAPAFGYGYETRYIYNMVGEDGKVYVWKTTTKMYLEVPYTGEPGWHSFTDRKGNPVDYKPINEGDCIKIKATFKGESEYKGQPQTEVNRVKVIERTFKAETPEEKAARLERERKAKAQAQRDSVKEGDVIWRMPYKQFKEHYSDCETIVDSYRDERNRPSTIEVIIRAGRLKESGVRGEHYSGYEFKITENGETFRKCYRAVSEENAERRCKKEFPKATEIICDKIYDYFRMKAESELWGLW